MFQKLFLKYTELTFYPIFKILSPKSFKKISSFQKIYILKNLRCIKNSNNYKKAKIQLFFHQILNVLGFFIPINILEQFHVSSGNGLNHLSWILFISMHVVVLFKIMIQFKFELIWMNSYGNIEVLLQAVLLIFKPARNPFLIISQ